VYLDHLVNDKKYTCIKYFVLMNEPNYSKYSFEAWKRGVLNVIANLKTKKLSERIAMVGSDESGSDTWHVEAVNQLANELGGYDLHCYTSVESIRGGGIFQLCQRMWGYALGKDPKALGKPLIIGEAGIVPPGTTATNPLGLDFNYGMYMADYATQAANGGSWAMCPWMLEDGSQATFTWGMWMNKAGNLALKPWFYPWALLSRTFPRGCKILLSSTSDTRVLAAEIPGTTPGWTFCLVNYSAESRKILSVAGAGAVKLDRYVYSRAAAKADADGFPIVDGTVEGNLNAGLEIKLPAESVVFLTTVK
jgi:hypothetical protein